MKLYTGRGDYGNTNVIGGGTLKKSDPRIEAYGSLDELNAFVGLLISQVDPQKSYADDLIKIQHYLFDAGTDLADPQGQLEEKISQDQVKWLEGKIDELDEACPKIEKFVLPGGSPQASTAHVCRTVCRRAERAIVALMDQASINEWDFRFINRLSDYFFALARYLNHESGHTETFYDRGGKVFH